MSGICGWIGGRPGSQWDGTTLAGMTAPLTRFDGAEVVSATEGNFGLAAAATHGRMSMARANGCAAVLWGRPRFTDSRLQGIVAREGHARALIESWLSSGPECCNGLDGAYAFAIANTAGGDGLLAVDRMGIHNIVYRSVDRAIVFASTADAIHTLPGVHAEVNWQALYNYVHFHMVPGPATAFRDEMRLLPGHCLRYTNGEARIVRYWRPEFVENRERPFAELRDEFVSTLTTAIADMQTGSPVGAFLSGGTDSSTIAGLLGRVTGKPADTFSIGFDQQGYDEMEYARIAARHFRTAQHEYYVTPADIVEAIPRVAAIHDQPFGNASAVPTYCCARLARESGMKSLLGGDGGDELFGGNERYATQANFALYECIPSALRRGVIEPAARMAGRLDGVRPFRMYRRAIELLSMPMPDRIDDHNLLRRLGPGNVFTADFLTQVDPNAPTALMRDVYGDTNAKALINRMLAYDFRITLTDSDLPKVMRSCELAGLPVDFPLLDDRVLRFSLTLAPDMKLRRGKLRYFFKEALKDILPPEIITKTKHGFGLPFGHWIRSHKPLEEIVYDSLGGLRNRGFVRKDFLDQLMNERLKQHAGYYGTMAWVLMQMEQWLRLHTTQRPA